MPRESVIGFCSPLFSIPGICTPVFSDPVYNCELHYCLRHLRPFLGAHVDLQSLYFNSFVRFLRAIRSCDCVMLAVVPCCDTRLCGWAFHQQHGWFVFLHWMHFVLSLCIFVPSLVDEWCHVWQVVIHVVFSAQCMSFAFRVSVSPFINMGTVDTFGIHPSRFCRLFTTQTT